ncbi:HU family DNA-binding protein [Bacteroides caccae]|jgi:predicted histone-like DNA-binding protein|uniref:HU family DNA-binding protein n=1 Tax=Bacteroides caccae TaxID=47678 RepID=UPI000EFEAFBF|nr:HU family DNA-binding protein [Bacteroides caccae]RHG49834.1 DNA-binding protein [Bacteroides caccae]
MAISFDWYENPVSPDKPEEKRFHPRIIANGQIDTKDLRSRIQSRCTLNEVDVTAVLDALSQVMGEELCEGRQVHLDGIGYFYPTLTATEEIAADTPRRNTKVKLKGIQFRSDQKLKNSVGHIKIKQMKRIIHSPKLSETDIDSRLKKYFTDHQIMQRSDFQDITGMVRSTAMIHIRRLRTKGKLLNIGIPSQPIYVPAPGFYGKPADYQPVK